jgi:thiol:disulfide interchange protein
VNGFIALLFIAFGLSLLGAFEITIPSPILTKLSQSSSTGGFIGTLLMGLTFALSSFACVGPFVGTLLAGSVQSGPLRPLVGMTVFATGLALPFFLLALFPSYLKRLPKSGGWMARVKIVMGFAILAFSLKYLSSLDQTMQWGLLPRERFLAVWVVLFAMAGLYLLGFLRLEGVKPDDRLGLGRLLTAIALLVFALSLVPGMFGGNLGNLEAFVPVASQSAGPGGASSASGGLAWMKDQYREALDRARRENKLVFVDFTGYNCANCHWMRGNILNRPEIEAELKNFVLVELYTDGVDAASAANAKLQQEKFGTISEPFYVILDPDERLVARFDGLTHDAAAFLAFLKTRPSAPAPAAAAATAPDSAIGPFAKLDGSPFDTAPLAGKVVVINFWATYCIPCIAEMPAFNKVYREVAPKGVAMVGVDMDEDASGVPAFLKKHPIEYPVAVGSPDTFKKYNIEALPVTLVLDRAGKLVKRFDGGTPETDLRAAIAKALE